MLTRSEKKILRKERRKKRNSIIIGLILVSLMMVSIIGFSKNTSENTGSSNFVYNGFTFKPELVNNNNVIFIASMNGQEIGYFYFQPKDTEAIEVPEELKSVLLNSKSVIVTQTPLSVDGSADVGRVYIDRLSSDLQTVGGIQVIKGINSKDIFDDRPVFNCEDATEEMPVFVYLGTYSGTSKISEISDYCYSIDAQGIDIIRVRDRIIYLKMNVQ